MAVEGRTVVGGVSDPDARSILELTSRNNIAAPQPTLYQPPAPLLVGLSKDEAVGGAEEEKEEINESALSEGSTSWALLKENLSILS